MINNTFGKDIIPQNDNARLEALKRYSILDTPSEASFDNIAKLATEIFQVPVSLISLVDADRVFFKSNIGMGNIDNVSRGTSICALSVLDENTTVFEDALKEPCLIANPNVAGELGLRFYAGAPLKTHDGFLIGTICIVDMQPRSFSAADRVILERLAVAVMDKIELRSSAINEIDFQRSATQMYKREAEKNMALKEELQLAINTANLGTWTADLATDMLDISKRSEEIHGLQSKEPITLRTAMELIVPEHRERIGNAIAEAIQNKTAFTTQYMIQPKDGGPLKWLLATGKASYSRDGMPLKIGGTLQDITEEKKSEQMKNDFIGMVSHELKTPLTSLIGYLQILDFSTKADTDQPINELITKAKKQSDKILSIITGFLDVARFGENNIRLQRKQFDMADVINEVEKDSLARIRSHNIIYYPVEYTPVWADQDKIEQVVINFINNAVKYSPKESTIHVKCITKDNTAYVSVTDGGMGISKENQELIFQRFYRVESAEMNLTSGFGIGLYICKEIIVLHDGAIGVDSILGEGSTFWFEIPLLRIAGK